MAFLADFPWLGRPSWNLVVCYLRFWLLGVETADFVFSRFWDFGCFRWTFRVWVWWVCFAWLIWGWLGFVLGLVAWCFMLLGGLDVCFVVSWISGDFVFERVLLIGFGFGGLMVWLILICWLVLDLFALVLGLYRFSWWQAIKLWFVVRKFCMLVEFGWCLFVCFDVYCLVWWWFCVWLRYFIFFVWLCLLWFSDFGCLHVVLFGFV